MGAELGIKCSITEEWLGRLKISLSVERVEMRGFF